MQTQPYYPTGNSLYKISEQLNLNSWEFDILKRIVRCRKKGQFESDLQKTKDVIDIYLTEYKPKIYLFGLFTYRYKLRKAANIAGILNLNNHEESILRLIATCRINMFVTELELARNVIDKYLIEYTK